MTALPEFFTFLSPLVPAYTILLVITTAAMLSRGMGLSVRSTRVLNVTFSAIRSYTTPASQSEADKKAEAAKVAAQAFKDMGKMFSTGSSDDETQPIDTRPIYYDPKLFGSLSLLHQGQVLKELQEKFDKKWHKLTPLDKKLGYYIAYGDWGVREDFKNWNTAEAPYDLPFSVPSHVKSTAPAGSTIIKKLEPVILAETPVRLKQFDTKKMDAVTKTLIYLTVFIAIFAVARDKNTGEAGKPEEMVIEDPYEIERQASIRRAEEEKVQEKVRQALEAERKRRKWYFLWLK